MNESIQPKEEQQFAANTNEYASLATNSDEAGEAVSSVEYVSLVRPEEVYANPKVIDRATYDQLFAPDVLNITYEKTNIESGELDMDHLVIAYDAETDKPLMNEWNRPDYDLQQQLNALHHPFMEFGGPTYSGFTIIEGLDLAQKIHVSNIYAGYPRYAEDEVKLVGEVDIVADITAMPIEDEMLGAVFASAIHKEQHDKALAESFRVLEPGGLAFWQNGSEDDIGIAQRYGFKVVRAMSTLLPRSRPQLSFVFQKPADSHAG